MPSPLTTVWFLVVLLYVWLCFAVAAHRAARSVGANTTLWTLGAIVGVAVWARLTATIQLSGVLDSNGFPIPLILYFGLSAGLAIVLALSPVGRTFAAGLPVAWMILFQGFRLPLELILHAWYRSGTQPVQMTCSRHNYDIVTGLLAFALGLWAWRMTPPRALIWGFEVIGTGLLFGGG